MREAYEALKYSKENQRLFREKSRCDKVDYLTATACGAISGMMDIFLVGSPEKSLLGKWSDAKVDHFVMLFAKKAGWNPRKGSENNLSSAIGFLERNYKVNYDQQHTGAVDGLFQMTTKNHHIKSLSHSPDAIGIFFSVLNQFTSTSSFLEHGRVITIRTEDIELQGHNIAARFFCGITNWFGHMMSDISGSSGSMGRGSGIVMPFYELFQKCNFGKFQVGKDRQDLATIAIKAYQGGYDLRYGIATSIPVVIAESLIGVIYGIRRYFVMGKPLQECMPIWQNADFRVMRLFGIGTLCIMDGASAGIKSGGNFLVFFSNLNLIAWLRFTILVLKEICIRIGLNNSLQDQIEAYKYINAVLLECLHQLENVDIEKYKMEVEQYASMLGRLSGMMDEEALHLGLEDIMLKCNMEKAWEGDFDRFLSDKSTRLQFK